jgi:hypothetical protein
MVDRCRCGPHTDRARALATVARPCEAGRTHVAFAKRLNGIRPFQSLTSVGPCCQATEANRRARPSGLSTGGHLSTVNVTAMAGAKLVDSGALTDTHFSKARKLARRFRNVRQRQSASVGLGRCLARRNNTGTPRVFWARSSARKSRASRGGASRGRRGYQAKLGREAATLTRKLTERALAGKSTALRL